MSTVTNSSVAVVVGNPKPMSRTRSVAERVATAAASAAGLADPTAHLIELAELGPQLFDWSSAAVKAQTRALSGCSLAVIATPVYKATYTGLLKSFLDWFGTTGLSGVTAIPVMVGGSPGHALAVEVHLRPLLIEIGATVPTRGLFVLEQELDQLDATITTWLEQAAPLLAASVRSR
jgi:FMN reductase